MFILVAVPVNQELVSGMLGCKAGIHPIIKNYNTHTACLSTGMFLGVGNPHYRKHTIHCGFFVPQFKLDFQNNPFVFTVAPYKLTEID